MHNLKVEGMSEESKKSLAADMEKLKPFLEEAEKNAFDRDLQRKILFNIGKYKKKVVHGKMQYADLDGARQKAKNLKYKAIEQLDAYLLDFEKNFIRNGGKVIWARDEKEATGAILDIARKANAKKVVKSKSMVTEELHLNAHLEKAGIEVLETDLGEFIVQLAGETPFHIVTPAMHKSKEDVALLFHEKFGTPKEATPEELTLKARELLRKEYLKADIGITGANFIIPDAGGIALTENEGNARLTTTYPRIHIAIAGIEKMIPSLADLAHFWPLLATYGTGQRLTVYNSILTGPKGGNEVDGPEEMYVILLDNGRHRLLEDPEMREASYCIRCGSCLNACPVYQSIGGHAYQSPYSGPIGSVISPHLFGMEDYGHLSYASSLCGSCTENCPVNIQLHDLLLKNREIAVDDGLTDKKEKWGWTLWRKGMLKRRRMNLASSRMKSFVLRYLFKNSWGKRRELPEFPPKSFNQQWRERMNGRS